MVLDSIYNPFPYHAWWGPLVLLSIYQAFQRRRSVYMIIGGCCLDIWDGREQCLPGGNISLIRDQNEIVGAGWLVRWLYDNNAIPGGLLNDVGGQGFSREENIFFQYTQRIMPEQGSS